MKANNLINTSAKTHFKMYKAGKLWLVSGISLLGIGAQFAIDDTKASANDTQAVTIATSHDATNLTTSQSMGLNAQPVANANSDTSTSQSVSSVAEKSTNVQELTNAKTEAKGKIDSQVQLLLTQISQNSTLNDSEKQSRSQAIKEQAQTNKNAIDQENNVDQLTNLVSQSFNQLQDIMLQPVAQSQETNKSKDQTIDSGQTMALSDRVNNEKAPSDSFTWLGGDAASRKEYSSSGSNRQDSHTGDLLNQKITLTYDSVQYNSQTGKYDVKFTYGTPVVDPRGLDRYMHFDFTLSDAIAAKTSNISAAVTTTNGQTVNQLTKGANGTYSVRYKLPKSGLGNWQEVGGKTVVTISLDPVKVTDIDWISGYMKCQREYANGTTMNAVRPAWEAMRSLTYDTSNGKGSTFGVSLNTDLLGKIQDNAYPQINKLINLEQSDKDNFNSQIQAVIIEQDFANVIAGIVDNAKAKDLEILANEKAKAIKHVNTDLNSLTDNQKNSYVQNINEQTDKLIVRQISSNADLQNTKNANVAILVAYGEEAKQKIKQLRGLNDNQIASALQQINNTIQQRSNSIQNASSADNVKSQLDGGKSDVDKILANQQQISDDYIKSSKTVINQTAVDVKAKITNDVTLDSTTKLVQKDNVDKEAAKAIQNIDNANRAADIAKATSNGVTAIQAQYVTGKSLKEQKDAAKNDINREAQKAKKLIDDDPSLSNAEKDNQKVVVDTAVHNADADIDQAKNADAINEALNKGKTAIDNAHQANKTSLDEQKATAKQAIEAEAQKIKGQINADNRLNDEEKANQSKDVESAAKAAESNIDKAPNAQAIIDATTAGKNDIDSKYQAGTVPVSERQSAAKKLIQAEAQKVQAEIDGDNTLTNQEKAVQKAGVKTATDKALANIDQATSAQAVINATQAGLVDIDNQHVPSKISLDGQKDAAKKVIDGEAAKVEAAINSDSTLTAEVKNSQKAKVQEAANQAKTAINQAKDAQAVVDATTTGQQNIDQQHIAGTALADQKQAAKQQIDDEAKQVKQDIDADKTLNDQAKQNQKTAVDQAASAAKQNIDTKPNADAIIQATTDGKNKVREQHLPAQSLAEQKAAAKADIDAQAQKVSGDIDNDPSLNNQEKQTQKANVTKAAQVAKNNIDQADNAQKIIDATNAGKADINQQHQPAQKSLAQQRQDAQAVIDAEAQKVRGEIDTDPSLDDQQKQNQKANVEKAAQAAKNNIAQAVDAQAIINATNDGKKTIDDQHVANPTSLDGQKQAAKAELDAQARAVKTKIDQDGSLTDAEKTAQKQAVDVATIKAHNQVDAATDAQGVINATNVGKADIDAQYKPSQISLAERKNQAKAAIDAEAKKVQGQINGDPTLNNAQKAAQVADVATATKTAKDNIDAATTAQAVLNAQAAGIIDIDGKYHPSAVSLQDQQKAAKDAIAAEAKKIKQAIDDDKSLLAADKAQQKQNVDGEATKADTAIDAATTAQAILNSQVNGIAAIDAQYVPNATSLDGQKAAGKEQIDAEAKKVKAEIAGDVTLNNQEKQTQQANVDTAATAAKGNIDQAVDASAVASAVKDGIAKIDGQHQPNKLSLADQKQHAQALIDAEAAKVTGQINDDAKLNDAQKAAQKNDVITAANTAKKNIDVALDAQAVLDAQNNGITDIDGKYQPGKTSIQDQQTAAKVAIDAQAAKVKKDIDQDVSLTDSQKNTQKNNVDSAATGAKSNIDAATTAQGILQAQNDGIKAINDQHVPSEISLAEQKAAAKVAIDQEATKVKADIAGDATLTDHMKAEQVANVDKEATEAKKNIDGSADAQGVVDATKTGIINIDGQHIANPTDLAGQKQAAKQALDLEARKVRNDIDQDVTLNNEQKASQKANVDVAATNAQKNVDLAANADQVQIALDKGIANIDAQHEPNKLSLADQKQQAKADIDAEATKIAGLISNDPTLNDAQKQEQQANVNKMAQAAKNNIDQALDAQAVLNATSDGKKAIDGQYVPNAISLEDQKKQAVADIDAQATKVKADIDGDKTLNDIEKAQQKNNVDDAANKAKGNIDSATTAQGVINATVAGKKDIDAQHVPSATTLDERKRAANATIDAQAQKVKAEIDNDPTLDNETKQAQKANVDQAAAEAKNSISSADTAQKIIDAVNTGITDIDKQHVPGSQSVDDLRAAALKAIADEEVKIRGIIDADVTLDNAEKATQQNNVIEETNKAVASIKAANDKQSIDNAKTSGLKAIDDQYIPGKVSLEDLKKNAIAAIDAEAVKIKGEIHSDVTLDDDEKNAQSAAVTEEAKKAKSNIDLAHDKQAVDDAKTVGIWAIDLCHTAGSKSIQDLKNDALKVIADEAAKVSKAIDADNTLDNATKAVQKNNVAQEAAKATENIKSVSDKQAVDNAVKAGIAAIDAQHVSGSKTVDVLKDEALKAIADEAAKVSQAIDADTTLDKAAKSVQKDNVAKEAAKATENIKAATDKQAVDDATKAGIKAIDAQHVSGSKTVPVLKDEALQAIADEAAKVSKDIDADATLDNVTKTTQKENVAKEATKATENIKAATDKQAVDDATAAGIKAIDAQHVSGSKTVPVLKDEALQAIADEAVKVSKEIDADATLDNATKAVQKENVVKEATKATESIKAATDKQGVDDATKAGIEAIDAQHVSGSKTVPVLKDDALKAIADEVAKVSKAIDADTTLDNATKAVQKDNVAKEAKQATENIKSANDKQGVDDATKAGIEAIDAQHIAGSKTVDVLKDDALKAIADEAAKVSKDIDADATLDNATKAVQKDNVAKEATKATESIKAATDKQAVDDATKAGIEAIDAQHVSGSKTVPVLKDEALQAIADEAAKVSQAIDNDATLDNATKAIQKDNVAKETAKATESIKAATDKQTVDDATKAGIEAIDAQHVSGSKTVDVLKDEALKAIADEAAKVSKDIDADATLDNA
ncbi:DUF1542 domain-containing protein, partial [Convivina intestini]